MNVFAIAAGMMAVIHLVAGWQRPRLAVHPRTADADFRQLRAKLGHGLVG